MEAETFNTTDRRFFQNVFSNQQQKVLRQKQTNAKQRIQKLKRLAKWTEEHKDEIRKALYDDFRKPVPETDLTEIYPVLAEIRHTVKHLRNWMKPEKVPSTFALTGTSSYIYSEPKGVCLIIAPWNYPFNLLLLPLISALAAGNCVILKPSEITPHTSGLISRMMKELFKPEEVMVIEGEKEVAEELLKLPFDHIFFTGSPAIGKLVMKAAAENLSSVTLELGGKSPVIVDSTANLKDAAEKITWGKWLNSGQTCIAPDYLLVDKQIEKELTEEISKACRRLFGGEDTNIRSSPDYARIVNEKHFNRLRKLFEEAMEKGGRLLFGGELNKDNLFIDPVLLADVPKDAAIWEEEIFGPILPIKSFTDLREATTYIRRYPKPLALYLFSTNKKNQQYVLENTTAGGVCLNDTLLQYLQPSLPFGGVNTSGIGKAHGKWGFKAFSNEKSVVKQRQGFTSVKPVYPPYTSRTKKLIQLMMKYL